MVILLFCIYYIHIKHEITIHVVGIMLQKENELLTKNLTQIILYFTLGIFCIVTSKALRDQKRYLICAEKLESRQQNVV